MKQTVVTLGTIVTLVTVVRVVTVVAMGIFVAELKCMTVVTEVTGQ